MDDDRISALADARGIGSLDELMAGLAAAGYDADPAEIEERYAHLSTDELMLLPLEHAFQIGPGAPEPVALVEDDETAFAQGDQA